MSVGDIPLRKFVKRYKWAVGSIAAVLVWDLFLLARIMSG
jgi:hypothetical protein